MKHFKLHELMEMARAGKKFKATTYKTSPVWTESNVFLCVYTNWKSRDILADWRVELEPDVVEFDLDCTKLSPTSAAYKAINDLNQKNYDKLNGHKWRVVCTEKIDGDL